ncbi:MAG: arginine--tRNA ligase [Candidatus Magasanikbacteria bacterium CG11_big_fil_rev_8_21_14_0_20_39_34]|uniref:Arginine--tRNA ligase n=1 Tax=Candidatus Magasanikbacteria bacterium CG11_big_fil_rev_8_21_14_0_20_39_34 TaxID=1974653 RepID=A0A2H0N834_9BACT|nr:MAG: arginine--tRNA ligase [Candidatus Magasanikbacteria bacterium CG11_big_fil_rev_8_21_14_0_20_39_34]
MNTQIKLYIAELIKKVGVEGEIEIVVPKDTSMGDFSFACFSLAKSFQKNPAEVAKDLEEKLQGQPLELVQEVRAVGPYLNFFVDAHRVVEMLGKTLDDHYGEHSLGIGKKYLVEFGCPNPMKAFHLGHLRNLITGESLVRILQNASYDIVRLNYQGDVGMHIAKSLYGMYAHLEEFRAMAEKSVKERVEFLGRCYAYGATAYEEDEEKKQEVIAYNDKVYERDESIQEVYQTARTWSLEYFDTIYEKLGSSFDRLYFESEMYEEAIKIVDAFLQKGVFKKSEGAIIFEGSKYSLHDRVFINSKGFPTYEAKDLALARTHFSDYDPDKILHVVGKDQTEYFKVVFQALEQVLPQSKGKEFHVVGGYLQLKGDQKMSSRKGNIVTGDQLIDEVQQKVEKIMKDSEIEEKKEVMEKVTVAALKYTMLKVQVSQDIAFDMESSVSLSGDSGPYLLYIVARIKSILEKAGKEDTTPIQTIPPEITLAEKKLIMRIGEFPEATLAAADGYDPSKIAQYLFTLAQDFNTFYHECPVLQAQGETKEFRLGIIQKVLFVMERGLTLLGIETANKM